MKAADLGKVLQSHTARQADLVTDIEKLELKSALKGPDGNPIQFKMDAPIMKAAAAMAQERGWTKSDLTAMAELVATQQMAAMEADNQAFLALGAGDKAKAEARYAAVQAKGAAMLGADATGKPTDEATKAITRLIAAIHTKEEFETIEKLVGLEAPRAAEAGGGGSQNKDIATSWYGQDGLSGMKKAS